MALAGLITLLLPGNRPVEVDPATLAMRLRGPDLVVSREAGPAHPVEGLERAPEAVRWRWPDAHLALEVAIDHGRVRLRASSARAAELAWPRTGTGPALLLPMGEGLRIEAARPFWRAQLGGQDLALTDGLTAPFFGWEVPGGTLSYLFAETPRTELAFGPDLAVQATHRWLPRDHREAIPYEVLVVPGPADPLAPAKAFRSYAQERHQWLGLEAKIKAKPATDKLRGAIHAYMWGDGRTAKAVGALKALGVGKAWLGFDGAVKDPKFVKAAVQAGFLVGPYDTYCNVQDPATADARTSAFDKDLFNQGGIIKANGQRMKGFGGRGWELSSEALRRANRDWIGDRLASYLEAGETSVFVDADADGQLFEDADPNHPMSPWGDRANRQLRLARIGNTPLVLGSETGTSWATPYLAFAHGAATVTNDTWWKLLSSKPFGGYWPEARPRLFFQPARVGADERRALFDPAARLPLYQAAFHDSLVTTERWELSPVKIQGLQRVRTLQELLYGVPSMWNLDLKALEDNGPRIRDLYRFFAPIHAVIATEPLTRFEVLTPDRLVQRTRFGDDIELTANFRQAPFGNQPPMSIMAKWLKTGRFAVFQPSPWWDG
jgi:hypothetical protein